MANNTANLLAEKETLVDFDIDAMSNLHEGGRIQKRREFLSAIENMDWAAHGSAELRHALDVSLILDMAPLSRELAQKGVELFPKNKDFQYFVKVLAPPKIIGTSPGRNRGLKESHRWFDNNASQYRGQWVAVHWGRFLAAAQTYKELKNKLDKDIPSDEILVVRVLGS